MVRMVLAEDLAVAEDMAEDLDLAEDLAEVDEGGKFYD